MKKEKIKDIFFKTILFIFVTILIFILYNKIFPMLYRYGKQIFYEKDYTKTEVFKEQFKAVIENLENDLNYRETNEISSAYFRPFNSIDTNIECILNIEFEDGTKKTLENTLATKEDILNYKVYYSCSLNEVPDTNLDNLTYYGFSVNQLKFKTLDVYIGINSFDKPDYFSIMKAEYEAFNGNIYLWFALCLALAVGSIVIYVFICKNLKEDTKIYFKNFYIEENILIVVIAVLVSYSLLFNEQSNIYMWFAKDKWLVYILAYFCLYEAITSLSSNLKFKKVKENLLILKIIKNNKKIYKTIILLTLILFVMFMYFFLSYRVLDLLIIYLVAILYILYILRVKIELIEINKNVEQMLKGNYSIKFEKRSKKFEDLETNLEKIQESIKVTVKEKIKSEKLKTDLITNVSHDLKTPLTSIVSYVKLLKKEEIENKKVKKYIEILEMKASKLKDLTEDLIEVSKLSSGNESVNMEKLNFAEMIRQANGEFAEKFEEKRLELVSNIEEENIEIDLDSKKMWRAIQNLYQNVYKYSLENTRVYVNLKWKEIREKRKLIFEIKNTSKEALNISPEELIERFVRGDKSRNTSGNGLGLSICKDLIELQKGKFEIEIMADLFVARIEM